MLPLIKDKKKILSFIILLPITFIALEICMNIIFNIGVYFGTIARQISEGVCCFH